MSYSWKNVVSFNELQFAFKKTAELKPFFYEQNNHTLANELILMIVLKSRCKRKLPISTIRYYLWKEREFRLWREKNPVFKFPNNYFPTLEKFEDNAVKAKIIWKQDKQLIKAKALKLKKINKLTVKP